MRKCNLNKEPSGALRGLCASNTITLSKLITNTPFPFSLKQTTNLNLPPEDLDSSGDDDDAFSGSGAGELLALVLFVLDPSRMWQSRS